MISGQDEAALSLRLGTDADAAAILDVILRSFAARPALDPPADALSETLESVRHRLTTQLALVAEIDQQVAGTLFLSSDGAGHAMLHRVGVLPQFRQVGVAGELVRAATQLAAERGDQRIQLVARAELTNVLQWWHAAGFEIDDSVPHGYLLGRALPIRVDVPTAADMQTLGMRLAGVLQAGDVIIAAGELGAGKTTFAQGLGAGLGVAGQVASPTFVLSRVHDAADGHPALVHVDAYRLASAAELEDLDLESSMAEAVTFIEWGDGLAEQLSRDRLELEIHRSADPGDEARVVYLDAIGSRWDDAARKRLAQELKVD